MPISRRVLTPRAGSRRARLIAAAVLLAVLAPGVSERGVHAQVVVTCPQGETQVDFPAGAISQYDVPADVSAVRLIGVGAHGGDDIDATGSEATGAAGAGVSAVFTVTPGDTLQILVGTRGGDGNPADDGGGGGGGGTFFGLGANAANAFTPANLLIVAGGGGGGGINFDAGAGGLLNGGDADISTGGDGGLSNGTGGAAGSAGDSGEGGGAAVGDDGADGGGDPGGGGGGAGAGGDGGDGAVATGGTAAVDGGAGGAADALSGAGGFGGGGGGGLTGGGGGGGYAGGGGGFNDGGGGGGSSFIAAAGMDTALVLNGIGDGVGVVCEIRAVPTTGVLPLAGLLLLLATAGGLRLRRRS